MDFYDTTVPFLKVPNMAVKVGRSGYFDFPGFTALDFQAIDQIRRKKLGRIGRICSTEFLSIIKGLS